MVVNPSYPYKHAAHTASMQCIEGTCCQPEHNIRDANGIVVGVTRRWTKIIEQEEKYKRALIKEIDAGDHELPRRAGLIVAVRADGGALPTTEAQVSTLGAAPPDGPRLRVPMIAKRAVNIVATVGIAVARSVALPQLAGVVDARTAAEGLTLLITRTILTAERTTRFPVAGRQIAQGAVGCLVAVGIDAARGIARVPSFASFRKRIASGTTEAVLAAFVIVAGIAC